MRPGTGVDISTDALHIGYVFECEHFRVLMPHVVHVIIPAGVLAKNTYGKQWRPGSAGHNSGGELLKKMTQANTFS